MLRFSRRSLLLAPLLVCACHTARTVPLAPKQSSVLPQHSWVVLVGGQRVPVDNGHATPDSIVGMRREGGRFAVPRDSVTFVEERKLSVGRTLGVGAAGLGVAATAAALGLIAVAMWFISAF